MIEGVKIKKLKIIPDERGRLMEILRRDDEIFQNFGQVYMTTAFPGVVKAWHYHKIQTDSFTCIRGKMRLGLCDGREGSPTFGNTEEYVISLANPLLVRIPPEVYHGFKCVSAEEAVVINTVTEPYNYKEPDEYRVDAFDNDIDFDWGK
ncbi:MAG: dTDP-4-dehydrorhamnose 3,5-epimerase family protein [Candidatus Omnitrophica bacterium]|nr:dTDP-4-dehydrorhamnose 3,5-epimerase family protein [Candidatus Omnitrophota bacterium]MBU1127994.1 dTDP-4-dehydrorhamnose 3,5-epimerase family protein [Candidatus Omnitrophota bacterium]MBU1783854.1 dTDP-4-dehydrorhamnose 3,5-epimerase family protein [Candidatus Omnitrophota bacterium]MBU1851502.1 dTDP-4-dehydrorhamnose 3,5-epimerase family protein [Candidatus Omnitrophota bacterium]